MKILLQGRLDLLSRYGGDTHLILSLQKELSKSGLRCNVGSSTKADVAHYDLIHFFGIMRIHDLYPYFLRARRQHKKIIVTPIYEDLAYLDRFGRSGWEQIAKIVPNDVKEFAKGLLRGFKDSTQLKFALLQLIAPYSRQQKNLLKYSNLIISTSYGESILIQKKFSLSKSKFDIIPIGIDSKSSEGHKDKFVAKYKLKNFVLCVGRIEPKKNQLALIDALDNTKIPLVFIGSESPYHRSYVKIFLKKIRGNPQVRYLGMLDRTMLLSTYAAAKVHVLPSWFEAPGITSMEAAVNGCNIVTTEKGYAKEYFGDFVWYCNPQDVNSIRKAVLKAYGSSINTELKELILQKYAWEKIAPQIIEAYSKALATN